MCKIYIIIVYNKLIYLYHWIVPFMEEKYSFSVI